MTGKRRRLAAIAAGTAIATLLAGCSLLSVVMGEGPGQPAPPPTSQPTDEEVPAELEPFYRQQLAWTSSGPGVSTTWVTVPVDWSDPSGATLQLAVARHHARGAPLGSLLINPGGPGGSGYLYGLYGAGVTDGVLAAYDLIGFDPRGVGLSTPVRCYDDPADMDALLFGSYQAPYGSEEWYAELVRREQEFIAACQAGTGELLGHLDAASVARDMDVIRAVLGDEQLDFLGYSYGSYLGTVYAELFPEKVGRMVLDGIVDPSVGDLEMLADQMAGFDSALRAYLQDCLASSGCPFEGSVDAALGQLRRILDEVDARRLRSSDGRLLDQATLGTAIGNTLYSSWGWGSLTLLLEALERGDADPAFDEADGYYGRYGSYYDGNGYEVYVAVICDEGTLAEDGVDVLAGLDRIEEAAPVLGRAMAYDDYAVLEAACTHWPYPTAELPESFRAEGAAPILLIGTTNDPATPYANAVSLAAQLDSAVLVSYEGEGHTVYSSGLSSCVDDAVDRYLLDGVVPQSDPKC